MGWKDDGAGWDAEGEVKVWDGLGVVDGVWAHW